MSRQTEQHEAVYGAWFKMGHWLGRGDQHRGANEGLGDREIKALNNENSTAYGRKTTEAAIRARGRGSRE